MNKEETKEINILTRHTDENRFNLSSVLLEIDTRLKMLEEAMAYLAEAEKKKLGISNSIDNLILPDKDIVIPNNI